MNNLLHREIAQARIDTLRAEATVARTISSQHQHRRPLGTLAVRFAHEDERGAIRRLADLDSRRAPAGDVLLGVLDGELVAALSLTDDSVVADPFRATADTVALMRLRAEHIRSASTAPVRRRGFGLRLAA